VGEKRERKPKDGHWPGQERRSNNGYKFLGRRRKAKKKKKRASHVGHVRGS